MTDDRDRTAIDADAESITPPKEELARRSFFVRFLAGTVGVIVGVVPFAAGLAFFFDPLLRKRASGEKVPDGVEKDEEGYVKLNVTINDLPADGTPQMYKVHDDVVDAWNRSLNVEIGSVWLRRNSEGEVVAFSSICPHMGCAVDFRSANRDFYCPCHTSTFDLEGVKQNEIPPRGMDTLKTRVKDGGTIWVKYEKFRATIPEKMVANS